MISNRRGLIEAQTSFGLTSGSSAGGDLAAGRTCRTFSPHLLSLTCIPCTYLELGNKHLAFLVAIATLRHRVPVHVHVNANKTGGGERWLMTSFLRNVRESRLNKVNHGGTIPMILREDGWERTEQADSYKKRK